MKLIVLYEDSAQVMTKLGMKLQAKPSLATRVYYRPHVKYLEITDQVPGNVPYLWDVNKINLM